MTSEEKAKKWIEEQDFLWLSVTETERLIKAYEAGQAELAEKVKELENKLENIRHYLDYDIPHDLINEATTKVWRMLK